MRVWSYVLLGLLFLGLAGPISAQQNAAPQALVLSREETDWLARHPVVRLGIDPSYGPYSFLDEKGELQGVVREFLTHIEQALGLRFEIVSNLDWPHLMEAVQQQRIDAVATVVRLPERDAFLEFTGIYLPTPLVVMTRNDTPQLRSLNELPNLRLTLVEGYSSSKQVMALNPAIRPFFVTTPLDGLRAVASGSADAYVGVLGVNTFLASQHGIANLKVNAAFDMADNGQRFGVRKDWPELAGLLDKALGTLPAQRRADIMQRWLPIQAGEIRRLSQPTLVTRLFPWLLGLFGLAAGAYLVVLLWNHRLKRELARERQELERLHSTLQALVEGSTDAIFVKDIEGRYIVGNRALAALLDRPITEIVGVDDHALFPPEVAERFRADDRRVMQRGATENYEETVVVGDKHLPYLTTKGPLLIDGKVEGVFGIARDISLLKQSASAVRISEERYRTLFEYAPDGIVIADRESYYLDANPAICRMLGYTRAELIGLHASDIVVGAEHLHIAPALTTIKDGKDYQREWQFRRKDGSTFVAEVIATLMPDGNLLGVIRDITGRMRAEQTLHDQLDELTRWQAVMLGREDRIQELKAEVNALLAGQGKPIRYPSQAEPS